MADGFLGGLLGGGEPSAPGGVSQDNPFGLSEQDRNRIMYNTLGQLGATLLAAGQKQMPAQRAQYLAQLGNIGSNTTSQMYQLAQGRLMAAQYNEKMQEMRELEVIRNQLKENPGELASLMGLEEKAVTKLPATDIRAILRQKQITEATRLPEEREIKKIELQQRQADLERSRMAAAELQRRYGPQADGAAQAGVAPQGEGVPVEPGAAPAAGVPGVPAVAGAAGYRLPAQVVGSLMAGGKKPTEILALEAQEALKQQTFIPVPTGQNAIRAQLGVSPTQPLKVKVNSSGQVVDYELLGEDPNKPPAGFRVAESGRLEPIPGGPATQLSAEVAARVGLGDAFKPYAKELIAAADEGFFSSPIGKIQVATGTGRGGALWRRMEDGRESLFRGLTGAGSGEKEAARQATRYELQATDSEATVRDKINMLQWSLENVEYIVKRGRGEDAKPTRPPPPYGAKYLPEILGKPADQGAGSKPAEAARPRRYNFETGMIE